MDGEEFVSSDSEKKRLIDEAERQHGQMFPDKPENSFINASTSQVGIIHFRYNWMIKINFCSWKLRQHCPNRLTSN